MALASLSVAGACRMSGPRRARPQGAPAFETVGAVFYPRTSALRMELAIPLVYANQTAETTYVAGCYSLWRETKGAWRHAFSPVCVGGSVSTVPPGASFSDTVRVEALFSGLPGWLADTVPGLYYVERRVYLDPPIGSAGVPREVVPVERRSNLFRIQCRGGTSITRVHRVVSGAAADLVHCAR